MADLSNLRRMLSTARGLTAALAEDPHNEQLQIEHDEAWGAVDTLLDENLVCIGVGDGSGNKFVYGNYDSVKACQNIITRHRL